MRLSFFLLIFLLILMFGYYGWVMYKIKKTYPSSFVVNGDCYNNQLFIINAPELGAKGRYDVKDNKTGICILGENASILAQIKGKTTGVYAMDSAIFMISVCGEVFVWKSKAKGEQILTITEYGGVDGSIKGTFSGEFHSGADSNRSVSVLNGSFHAIRMPDK